MGIFDFIRSLVGGVPSLEDDDVDTGEGAAPALRSPWPDRLRGFDDFDDQQKFRVASQLLEELGGTLENPKIKPLQDDDEVELRARLEGVPMRVNLEYDMGWIRPEFKIENHLGTLRLERDHSKIAKTKDNDDDWADDDQLRVFVAKGIYVEGYENYVEESLATVKSLPPELLGDLLENIETYRLRGFTMGPDSLEASSVPGFDELEDPVVHIAGLLRFMHRIAVGVAASGGDPAGDREAVVTTGAGGRLLCAYCSTRFLPLATTSCPNCGAAHPG